MEMKKEVRERLIVKKEVESNKDKVAKLANMLE
jgi:hypothetical protein